MNSIADPAAYEAWYHTPRGRWIGDREFTLLQQLLRPEAGASLLDVGCGTGHFSRRFAGIGLSVTGIDPGPAVLKFAMRQGGKAAIFAICKGMHWNCHLPITALNIPSQLPAFASLRTPCGLCRRCGA